MKILKFGMVVIMTVSLLSCKGDKENQSVEINTPQEVKKAEKKSQMLQTRILSME